MIIDVDKLKKVYLAGIEIRDSNNNPLDDEVYQTYIEASQDTISREVDMVLETKQFIERYDYRVQDYGKWGWIDLYKRPIQQVSRLEIVFADQSITEFPLEWVRVSPTSATIQLLPTTGTIAQYVLTGNGGFLPTIFFRWDYAPQLWQITYTAGFKPGECPRSLVDIVAKMSIISLAESFMDLIVGPGVAGQSVSVDGVSQSTHMLSQHPRIHQYRADIKEFYDRVVPTFRGVDIYVC